MAQLKRQANRVLFGERVNEVAATEYFAVEKNLLAEGSEEVVLDFSHSLKAYPNGMVPIIARVLEARRLGRVFRCDLPKGSLSRLFLNANWAHLIDPTSHRDYRFKTGRHLPAQTFAVAEEQTKVVNAAMNIVMGNMRLDRAAL